MTTHALEKSTYVVRVAFLDEDGAAETPTAITWTLSTSGGTVINSRTNVIVAVPASTIDVVLSGLDLAFQTGEYNTAERILTVNATYTSALGAGLPLKEEFTCHLAPQSQHSGVSTQHLLAAHAEASFGSINFSCCLSR
jgi:hypothetical protein